MAVTDRKFVNGVSGRYRPTEAKEISKKQINGRLLFIFLLLYDSAP